MNTVEVDARVESEDAVCVTDSELKVRLSDGRAVSVPLEWYPRLLHATHAESRRVRLIGKGSGIHWPDLDEDVSVAALLAGKRSRESPISLARWQETRAEQAQEPLEEDLAGPGDEVPPSSQVINRHTMIPWVVEALKNLGGSAGVKDVLREIWKRHGKEIRAAGDAFYDWSYEVRWSRDLLKKEGRLESKDRGIWQLIEKV